MDDAESDLDGASPSGDRPETSNAPEGRPPARDRQRRQLLLTASVASLLLLALLVDVRCSGTGTAPTAASPTATLSLFVSGQLTATAVATQVPAQLRQLEQRPLHLPTLAPGAACPLVPARRLSNTYGLALGLEQGPVYAEGFNLDATLDAANPSQFGGGASAWGGEKLLWMSTPANKGAAIVRGQQLEGPNALRFNGGLDQEDYHGNWAVAPLLLVLHLYWGDSGGSAGTYVRMQASGCYGMQVDGLSFSYVIVFQAVMHP